MHGWQYYFILCCQVFFSFGLYVWDLSYRYCFIFYSLLPGFFFFPFGLYVLDLRYWYCFIFKPCLLPRIRRELAK